MDIPLNHDAWQVGALGSSAQEIYELLLDKEETLTKVDIVRRTRRDPSTVRVALKRLEKYGLVVSDGRTYWSALPVTVERLDEIAKECGTFGKAEKRKLRHQREREWQAAYTLFRTPTVPVSQPNNSYNEVKQ